jgi:hypothetical protein
MLSDAELFDFNAAQLADYDDERAHAALENYGDAFRYQLVAALHLDAWADRVEEDDSPAAQTMNPLEVRGYVNALREVAASIRQCAYLPGGIAFESVQRREP